MTAFAYLLQVVCDWENQYKQTDIWIDINGEVKVGFILSKMSFPESVFFMHMFNMSLHESAKY